MLTIILSVLLFFIVWKIVIHFINEPNVAYGTVMITLVVSIGGVISGIFGTHSGFSESNLISTTKLIQLSSSTATQGKGLLYVSVTPENVYSYRYEVESSYNTENTKAYVRNTLSKQNGNIIEIEDPNCKVPELRYYRRKANMSIWTFGVWYLNEYVFYVPEGSIDRGVNLK